MAVKVYDGFDHYGAQQDLQARAGALQWDDVPAGAITFVTGRGGFGFAASIAAALFQSTWLGGSFNQNLTGGNCGVSTKAILGTAFIDYSLMDYVNNVRQITVRFFMDSGVIQAWAGNPNLPEGYPTTAAFLYSTAPNAFSPFVWNAVEVMATIAASTGTLTVAVNGSTVFNLTNVQTQAPASQVANPFTPNSFFNGFRIDPGPVQNDQSQAFVVDDFRLTDLTNGPGSYPLNGLIGDVAVRTTFPVSNYSVTWTPLAGANWQEVSEVQFDGDLSYNIAPGGGAEDLFNMGSLPGGVSIVFAVQTTGAYRKLNAGSQTIRQSIVSAGTAEAGATNVMSVDYTYFTDLYTLDPNTGATWTPAAVNAVIAGYTKIS